MIRFFRIDDCETTSVAVLGVRETQDPAEPGREFEGLGVVNLSSKVEITFSGSKGTIPAPRKPP